MEKYVCSVCGYVYDPAVGVPEEGIAPGTPFDQLPEGFLCPICGVACRPSSSYVVPTSATARRVARARVRVRRTYVPYVRTYVRTYGTVR